MPADKKMKTIGSPDDGYEMLAIAVIKDVCREYREALAMRDEGKIRSCESFLRGPRFEIYCRGNVDPEYLIKRIREEIYGC